MEKYVVHMSILFAFNWHVVPETVPFSVHLFKEYLFPHILSSQHIK